MCYLLDQGQKQLEHPECSSSCPQKWLICKEKQYLVDLFLPDFTSSIPNYFQNSEPPIICNKYNKPIRNTIFNFNKLVSDLDIHANTPSS